MDIPESKVHSFIIKLWIEDAETKGRVWHGYITHVPDGGRRYLQSLHDILSFVEPYVAETGAVTEGSRARWWWKLWSRRKR
jgi:hypothetical protein